MAQHDYVIDNSTGANVRADINSVLQAIASNNSGSSAPSTTYAFQLFANTTTSKLQIRNAANNAFVDLLSLDGSILLADGSASSPSLSFSDDTNTGIFSSAADTLNIATGGTERFVVDSSGRVGINGSGVNGMLEVRASGGGGNTQLTAVFGANEGTTAGTLTNNNDKAARIGFNHYSTSEEPFCFVSAGSGSSANNIAFGGGTSAMNAATSLTFHTAANTTTTTGTQRMSIDSSGRVLVGTSTPVMNESGFNEIVLAGKSEGAGIHLADDNNNVQAGMFTSDVSSAFVIRTITNNPMFFRTNNTERMRIAADGKVHIGLTNGTGQFNVKNQNDSTQNAFEIYNDNGVRNAAFSQNSSGDATLDLRTNAPLQTVLIQSNGNSHFSGGNLGIGTSSPDHLLHCVATSSVMKIDHTSSGDTTGIVMRHARGNLSGFSGKIISFTGNSNTEVGTIRIGLSSTSYNTSSDYRLKENATAISDGITRLKTLKPYKFNWINDDTNTLIDGFFAHEVSSAVPEAITGIKDAVATEDTTESKKGDPIYQQIDQSKLVPLLVAAVQELIGKVEALEAA